MKAIGEDDRYFHNFHPLLPNFMRHLDLKAVAVGAHLIQVDGGQAAAAKALKTARWIGKGHPGNPTHVTRGAGA